MSQLNHSQDHGSNKNANLLPPLIYMGEHLHSVSKIMLTYLSPFIFLGGTISIVTRAEHLQTVEEYRDKLEPLMLQLEREGKWKQIKRDIFKGFFLDKDGIVWKYKVC